MKFIITESRMERILSKYLDLQDFVKVEKDEYIYFVNSTDDGYGQIRYDKNDGWCFIYIDLVDEISSFFSLEYDNSKEIIGKWVENTLQMKVSDTLHAISRRVVFVENTLQMKVSNTYFIHPNYQRKLRIPK